MEEQIPVINDKTSRFPRITADQKKMLMIGISGLAIIAMSIQSACPSSKPKPNTTHEELRNGGTTVSLPPATTGKTFAEQVKAETEELQRQKDAAARAKDTAERVSKALEKHTFRGEDGSCYTLNQGIEHTRVDAVPCAAASAAQFAPPQYAYTPPAIAPTARERVSNVALSFREGATAGQEKSVSASPASELHNYIQEQKAELAKLMEVSQMKSLPPVAAAVASAEPAPPVPGPSYTTPARSTAAEPKYFSGPTYRLFEDSLIECVLLNRLIGDFTGPVICQVSVAVYSHDNQHILIPPGSHVLGTAKQTSVTGQKRLAIAFHRILMPDGFSVDLDQFNGLEQNGATGITDKVDNHLFQVFGSSVALGLVSGFSQFGTGSALTTGGFGQYRQGVSSSLGQSSSRIIESRLNILPTIEIREGHRMLVVLTQDIQLPDYKSHTLRGDL